MNYYNFEEFTEDCNGFNEIAGKSDKLSIQDFKDQLKLIQSELKEMEDGINNNNIEEILDGFLDVFVTNAGIGQKLQRLGVDIYKAARLVADNNYSKFISGNQYPTLEATLKNYIGQGVNVYAIYDIVSESFVVKRASDDKVMKPIDFKSVNLEEVIPKDLLKNGITKSFEG